MRILFLAPRLPWPLDTGGKIRTYNILRQIARHHHVDLVCFSFGQTERNDVAEFERLGIFVKLIPLKPQKILQKIRNVLINRTPFSVTKYYSPEMEDTLIFLTGENDYDLIHFDHLHMTQYRSCFDGIPCILDEHNVEYKIIERCAEVTTSMLKRTLFHSQAEKMRTFELQKIKEFAACLAVSKDDKNLLENVFQNGTPIHVLPNGVDTEYFQSPVTSDQSQIEDSLVFTGSMDWLPNEDAVVFFCREILPLIWQSKGNVKFYVVGKNPSKRILEFARKDSRIIPTDTVNDVRPFIAQSKIFVVPLRIGGGTRLKILEAMSMEKAVISTTLGAEGIAYTKDQDIIIADAPLEFAQRVISLLENEEICKRIGLNGRRLVCDSYDWSLIGEKLNQIYEGVKC